MSGGKDIRCCDLFQQSLELGIGELDAVERFKFLAEILLQRGTVADVGTVGVLEIFELGNEISLDNALGRNH